MTRGFVRFCALAGATILGALMLVGASAGGAGSVAPNQTSQVDCNGLSPTYKPAKLTMAGLCTDAMSRENGKPARFEDNGRYIGHDEPSVKFISSAPGTGSHMTYYVQLPVDPTAAPTLDGSVSDYAELSPAPWFGLPICDPKSYPQNPCTPASDSNTGLGAPSDAGDAFMELQLYPPGYQPWITGPSCDATHYCAALNIDSLACTFNFGTCNDNCIEPVNFAWLQRDGVPAGPPSPQLTDFRTLTPNGETLLMNQGDSIRLTIEDTPDGLKTVIDDLSTGQSGFMVASAANGFMNTNMADCSGAPFSFHPEYDTASQQNQVPWAALEAGVLMEDELGHFETCASLSDRLTFFPFDPLSFQTCHGGNEGGSAAGEGPCNFTTGVCVNPTTEGGGPCPTNNFTSGAPCEFSDGICHPAGPRPVSPDVMGNGASTTSWPIAGCGQNITQNGDLDFDGSSYLPDYPDGTSNHPTSFRYEGPFDAAGKPYPQLQFETNVAGSEANCNFDTGDGCKALPDGAAFYPFWSIGKQNLPTGFPASPNSGNSSGNSARPNACLWNFGNDIAGATTDDFGKTAEYGVPNLARFAGTLTSPVIANPELTGNCRGKG